MHKIEYHPPRVLVFLRLVSRIVHDEFTGYTRVRIHCDFFVKKRNGCT